MDPLIVEAIRIYRRYQTEIVEALNLCPWAERTRVEGRVEERVIASAALDESATLSAIAELSAKPTVEIGLLLFPRVSASRTEFDDFVARVIQADSDSRPLGSTPFAMAAFHPRAEADFRNPERLIPFLRRTPDPTIQLVRVASLDRVREGFNEGTQFMDLSTITLADLKPRDTLTLRERIARANLRTVEKVGVEEIERRLSDIGADRDAAYARCAQ